jgi:dTDP-4-amino-4,6-dideoxygalactose transaminase
VTTDDADVARSVRVLAAHGSARKYDHEAVGMNSRLDAVQAVVLEAKLRRLDAWNAARRAAAARYGALLDGVAGVRTPVSAPGNEDVWHLYVVQVDDRDRVLAALHAAGIGAGVHYPVPVHLTGAYRHLGLGPGSCPVAEAAADRILSLPLHPHLTAAQQERVVDVLAAAVSGSAR